MSLRNFFSDLAAVQVGGAMLQQPTFERSNSPPKK